MLEKGLISYLRFLICDDDSLVEFDCVLIAFECAF